MQTKLHSISRRDIARAIIKKYRGTDRYYKITEHLFNKIISRIFELKVAQLYNTGCVNIGHGLGKVIITSFDTKQDDIKYFTIDWIKTKELWEKNAKSKEEKKLVRDLSATRQVHFKWVDRGTIPNLCYYSFRPSRPLRIQLYKDTVRNKAIMFLE
jgi:hypothetical protein